MRAANRRSSDPTLRSVCGPPCFDSEVENGESVLCESVLCQNSNETAKASDCHHTRTRGRRTNKQVFCLSHRAIASSTAPPRHTERLVKAASSPSQPQPQLDHSQRDRSQRCALNTVGTPWSRERSPARGGARACAGRALHKMRTISHKRGIRVLAGPCFARYREDGLGVACHWPQRPAWPRQSAKGDACAGAGTIHRR